MVNKSVVTISVSFVSIMITRGEEQKAVEALSFTQARLFLLYQQYTLSIQTILGDEKEWGQVLILAKSHQWTALKEFVSDKPVLKKIVFKTLELVSPRLYRVYFQDDHSTGPLGQDRTLVEVLYFCQHPLEVFCDLRWDGVHGKKWLSWLNNNIGLA